MSIDVRPTSLGLDLPAEAAAPIEGVRRIAVLRANELGDYVVPEPAHAALRSAYPEAEITLLGAAHYRGAAPRPARAH